MDYASEYYHKDILVLGCGNILFGDDGFGNAVSVYLNQNYKLPDNMAAIDVGTSVREIIFNLLLSEKRPKTIILADALQSGRQAGEVFIAKADDVTANKIHDFSLHMTPTINMLKEFTELADSQVIIIAAEPQSAPDEFKEGLSVPMQRAVREAAEYIMQHYV
ncbi:MAG: hydrogenase maturation protease [Chloroflexi bacterium]|nr:hydrogenase maturation protease [Chloroflexota bacterium]